MRGMAVEAATGADAAQLNEIVDVALTAWPASKKRGRPPDAGTNGVHPQM